MPNLCRLLGCFFLAISVGQSAHAESSPFDFAEPVVLPSPIESNALQLDKADTIVDFDVAPNRPEAAIIVKTVSGKQKLVFWKIDAKDQSSRILSLPDDIILSAVAWHPLGQSLFLLGKSGSRYEILRTDISAWNPSIIYNSKSALRRLVISPRPFSSGTAIAKYRIFFGTRRMDGTFSTHTITESGDREYAVLDAKPNSVHFPDSGEDPNTIIASDALPEAFHPAGHFMLWEDGKHCFQKAVYAGDNWNDKPESVIGSQPVCNGSITYTPNGAALLHWQGGKNGVELIYDHGKQTRLLANDMKFLSTPSTVADGKGLVGVTAINGQETIKFIPINTPLADVVNAWMFMESPHDRELLTANSGLFRTLDKQDQLYQLYDTESYKCGGYDESTPTRPYLVSTDIFWELYGAAFEGIFILSERQSAIPSFWDFVSKANIALNASHSNTKMAKVFATLMDVHNGTIAPGSEASKIMEAKEISVSLITKKDFDFSNLKPRSHYVTDADLQNYFRASKYLTDITLEDDDIAILKSLPQDIQQNALAWIKAYEPFIAPSRSPIIWGGYAAKPDYIQSPPKLKWQVFPLSWGVDNEILDNVVYDRISDKRELPSGLDMAAVLGSNVADVILEESGEYSKYPSLRTKITDLRTRLGQTQSWSRPDDGLYEKWLAGLATQWTEEILSPDNVIQKQFWQRKRLQTGLASWATLRHATVLVNERTEAECGEAGFESVILTPPRGYVEPDPKTFEAIATLFDATIESVKISGISWKGITPDDQMEQKSLQAGIVRRLTESRDRVRAFRDIATKETEGKPLSNQDYEDILFVGRAAEHNLLIFKSLAKKYFALSTPDPITKVADIAGKSGNLLLAGVGRPAEWDQVVPFFGRKEVVKGVAYSYYEYISPTVMTDKEWTDKVGTLPHPQWIAPYFSSDALSCPARAP